MVDYRRRFEHHLILQMGDDEIEEASKYLALIFSSASAS
jgi:D-lactate dehydrogenase (quinone)